MLIGRWSTRLATFALVVAATACSSPAGTSNTDSGPAPSKVAPRWERVATFTGSADDRTQEFDISAQALQWRVTASCTGSHLRVTLGAEPVPLVEPSCPGRGFGFSIRTGPADLEVAATGGWEVGVDQQLDTPVAEPRLDGMTDGSRLAEGSFYGIDQAGSGTVTLYRLPDGGRALRLDPFRVTSNSDLFVWLSEADTPRTSEEAFKAPHVQVDSLKATAGAQNYVLPGDIPTERIKSVIVWCEPVRTAYAAASLAG